MVLLLLMTLLMGKDYARAGHGAKGGAHSHHQRAVQNFLQCGRFNALLRAGWGEGDYWRAGRVGRFGGWQASPRPALIQQGRPREGSESLPVGVHGIKGTDVRVAVAPQPPPFHPPTSNQLIRD